jgi:outer membrane protein assembly factor BamA
VRDAEKGDRSTPITQADILERFKERSVKVSFGGVNDPAEIKKAQVAIKELLSERGHKFAVVNATYENLRSSNNAVRLVFTVTEGKRSR